ncbi:hypothetical protein B0H11DRAFT_2214654 [Mycena galericulata]|nr:hypothetical protein B0H11DRAFT_2214654 [Mycena galericulata]
MSFQKDRVRTIMHYSRRQTASVEEFREAIRTVMQAYDDIPVVQQKRISREVCFSMGSAGDIVQNRNFSSCQSSARESDAIFIMDFGDIEKCREVDRDPEVVKFNNSLKRDGIIEMVDFMVCEEIAITGQLKKY